MINKNSLLENGYKEWSKENCMNQFCNRFFQKRFRNENGDIKYFITVYEYNIPRWEDELDYEVDLQFEKENYTMNLTLFCLNKNMTVEQMEKEVYDIWYNLDCKYYEKYE
jgi:hypothetical protein